MPAVLGQPTRVYRNLHKSCYSVQQKVPGKGWRVVEHAECVKLRNCSLKVSKAGRERSRRLKKKTVHAFVEGELMFFGDPAECDTSFDFDTLHYSPFNSSETFRAVDVHGQARPCTEAHEVVLDPVGAYVPNDSKKVRSVPS